VTDTATLTDKAKKTLATGIAGTMMALGGETAHANNILNNQVYRDAEHNSQEILGQIKNNYSRDLQILEKRFSQDSTVPAEKFEVTVIDPVKFVAAQALGMTEGQALAQGLPEQIKAETNPASLDGLLQQYAADHGVYSARFTLAAGSRFGFVMPVSEHALQPVQGLSEKEKEMFLNSHEAWHCIDDKLDPLLKAQKDAREENLDPETLQNRRDQVTIETQKQEAFADMGALGDRILGGYGTSTIDKVIAWRASRPDGADHYTTKTLQEFKSTIDDMGITKFNALSRQELKELYHSLADDNALTRDDLRELEKISVSKKLDWDAHRVLSDGLASWNYKEELQKKALAIGGEISPTTLLKAYAQRQDELRQENETRPQSETLTTAKMHHLAENIKGVVRDTDYVRVNQENGVDLKTAPSFSKFMKPPEEQAKLDAAPHAPRIADHGKPAQPSL
jgi:hypothetical protein